MKTTNTYTSAERVERLRAAAHQFHEAHGRRPVIIFDADGVIYRWEEALLAHYHRYYPSLPPIEGPFASWDTDEGQSPVQANALLQSMEELDYSSIEAHEGALAVIPVLMEVGVDVCVATSHSLKNIYSASAKVDAFHRDFNGMLDERLIITLDKTRTFGDWLVDDKPEIRGHTDGTPFWKQVFYTQQYNVQLPGPRLVWQNALEVLTALIETKAAWGSTGPSPHGLISGAQGWKTLDVTGIPSFVAPDLPASDSRWDEAKPTANDEWDRLVRGNREAVGA